MNDKMPNAVLENVRLIFRNFSGMEGKYNRKGDRNFAVLLPTDLAEQMLSDGWNIKWLKAKEEGEEDQAYLKVTVRYIEGNRPPRVVMVTSRGKTMLDESMVGMLDWADITHADMILRPYHWEVSGNTGVAAYLQSLYVTIQEDELEIKYGDIPSVEQGIPEEPANIPPWDEED